MSESLALLNGEFVLASSLCVPVDDAGFVLGATVTEQMRTFGGKLFRPEAHLARLGHSLQVVEIDLPVGLSDLASGAEFIAHQNHQLDPTADLGLVIFATPGAYAPIAEGRTSGPRIVMHTFRLPFERWAALYDTGCRLVTTPVQQVPAECWPPELKCRSRMHYYLAELAAAKQDPQARALFLDRHGHVTETATANVLAYRAAEGLVSPPRGRVLPGISLMFVRELAESLRIPYIERDVVLDDLLSADEVLLTSTPNCLLPVVRLNGKGIGEGRPGETYQKLLAAWSDAVGVDIAGQAKACAT